jgi:type III secretory pathway component EscR
LTVVCVFAQKVVFCIVICLPLFVEQIHKQWSTKYYSENDYLSKKKQWSTKYSTEKDYLSKNTNNGQKNTIQKTTI